MLMAGNKFTSHHLTIIKGGPCLNWDSAMRVDFLGNDHKSSFLFFLSGLRNDDINKAFPTSICIMQAQPEPGLSQNE